MAKMDVVSYGYKLTRNKIAGCWLFSYNAYTPYELHKGSKTGTYYVTEMSTGKTLACAGTLRDAVIKACQLEGLV